MDYKGELKRYIKNKGYKYSKNVIKYGKNMVKRVENTETLSEFFLYNNIGIYQFLEELMTLSQMKEKSLGCEKLDENEINQIFGTVILKNELLKLQLKDYIFIKRLDDYNEFVYELTNKAQNYFKTKYGVKMDKELSLKDVLIITIDRTAGEDEESPKQLN